ncbi:magnesium chelatase, partial [Pseudomonas aeruginosa]|nr:magnesium chelatase [Pseudomonas aeruginosa]
PPPPPPPARGAAGPAGGDGPGGERPAQPVAMGVARELPRWAKKP